MNDQVYTTEYEKKIHDAYSKGSRLIWVETNPDKWSYEVKSNVICKLKINIENDLREDFITLCQNLEYQRIYNNLNVCLWPECDATNKLKTKFRHFENEDIKYHIFALNGDKDIYPHFDPIRPTSFYIPLIPRNEKYAPLEIYYDGKAYGVSNGNEPIVYAWNTKIMHAVFARVEGLPRYNIQISLYKPYAEIFQKYKDFFEI